jgi:2-polyprenyl-6-methoxyphenol hydroxylase-like FAD-dependent oxidoreductase
MVMRLDTLTVGGPLRERRHVAANLPQPAGLSWRRGGVFLVGNAAGESHPLIAEGVSMAIQGAQLPARTLIAHREDLACDAISKLGADYAAEWKACFGMRLGAAELFARVLLQPNFAALLQPVIAISHGY